MDGVKDIRLIRDRVTNESRGFGFVEFMDIEVF
jgi:RNA recognition motif-containing protein